MVQLYLKRKKKKKNGKFSSGSKTEPAYWLSILISLSNLTYEWSNHSLPRLLFAPRQVHEGKMKAMGNQLICGHKGENSNYSFLIHVLHFTYKYPETLNLRHVEFQFFTNCLFIYLFTLNLELKYPSAYDSCTLLFIMTKHF